MTQKDLEAHVKAYSSEFFHIFDNKVILNWYPERILKKADPNLSLLELGIGHGYTTQRFSEYFSRHVVVEGSRSVIERFRSKYPASTANIQDFHQQSGLFS